MWEAAHGVLLLLGCSTRPLPNVTAQAIAALCPVRASVRVEGREFAIAWPVIAMMEEAMEPVLCERFARAGVPLRLARTPHEFDRRLIVPQPDALFMVDVRRDRTRRGPREFILLHHGSRVEVSALAVDRHLRQLVLGVNEPETKLVTLEWNEGLRKSIPVQHVVPASSRRFLIGMDERHLFVCPLQQKASSVHEAHQKLMPPAVQRALRLGPKRQGEWFFVPVQNSEVLEKITAEVALMGATRRRGIGGESRGRRAHVADEQLRLGEDTFVRGRVRHPDHHVLELRGWHRLYRNTERVDGQIKGMTWVD